MCWIVRAMRSGVVATLCRARLAAVAPAGARGCAAALRPHLEPAGRPASPPTASIATRPRRCSATRASDRSPACRSRSSPREHSSLYRGFRRADSVARARACRAAYDRAFAPPSSATPCRRVSSAPSCTSRPRAAATPAAPSFSNGWRPLAMANDPANLRWNIARHTKGRARCERARGVEARVRGARQRPASETFYPEVVALFTLAAAPGHRSAGGARLVGRAPSACRSSCRRATCASPSTATATGASACTTRRRHRLGGATTCAATAGASGISLRRAAPRHLDATTTPTPTSTPCCGSPARSSRRTVGEASPPPIAARASARRAARSRSR